MKKSGQWTNANFKSLGKRAGIAHGSRGVIGETGRTSAQSLSVISQQMLVTVQNLQSKCKQNYKTSEISITLIYKRLATVC